MARIKIAVDAMSGDLGPRLVISAAQKFIALYSDTDLLLVGDREQLLCLYPDLIHQTRISIVHSTDIVTMGDTPSVALRHKKNSSMWLALASLRDGAADACVSAGNTGALLAIAKYLINTFPGVDRPAICKSMPVEHGCTYLLDLGANINCTAQHLYQFALMGAVLATSLGHMKARIALLNIGTETEKGTHILKEAQALIEANGHLIYAGYIEANNIFSGEVDVIVCDGFHGNIALKASEGTARFIAKKIKKIFAKNFATRFLAILVWPLFTRLQRELDPAAYNGASFLGLQKTVVKSHGSANEKAFLQALLVAREQVIQQVPSRIQQQFSHYNF